MVHRVCTLKHRAALVAVIVISMVGVCITGAGAQQAAAAPTRHKTLNVDGLDIFYREAGPKHAPTILLLHGFPTS